LPFHIEKSNFTLTGESKLTSLTAKKPPLTTKQIRSNNERILRLKFIEQELAKYGTVIKEYRFARDIVGDGKGIRERLRTAGLKDWRFDYCILERNGTPCKLFIEYEGISTKESNPYTTNEKSGHLSWFGYSSDCMKYNAAALDGWIGLRYTVTTYKNITKDLKLFFARWDARAKRYADLKRRAGEGI
jgi:hypothetical protein